MVFREKIEINKKMKLKNFKQEFHYLLKMDEIDTVQRYEVELVGT